MSNKPLKASTKKQLEAIMQMKQKKIEELHKLPPYTVIFSEGIKTEPLYIQGLTEQVNEKYKQFTKIKRVEVIGTGYDILKDLTQTAIAHAKTLYDSYEEGTPPSRRTPATRVHELVIFLHEYL